MNQPPNGSSSNERIEAAKKQAKKWFLILITIGLILGALLSIGVVKILNELGLTEKPNRPFIEQIQQQ